MNVNYRTLEDDLVSGVFRQQLETEFTAAIAPKRNGSSTIGVKKSTVCAIAMSPVMRSTAASSLF